MDAYLSQNAEYKDQARAIFTKELGFEPNLQASMLPEIQLRNGLKKYDRGELKKEALDKYIQSQTRFIRHTIAKKHPEQDHLLDKKPS